MTPRSSSILQFYKSKRSGKLYFVHHLQDEEVPRSNSVAGFNLTTRKFFKIQPSRFMARRGFITIGTQNFPHRQVAAAFPNHPPRSECWGGIQTPQQSLYILSKQPRHDSFPGSATCSSLQFTHTNYIATSAQSCFSTALPSGKH